VNAFASPQSCGACGSSATHWLENGNLKWEENYALVRGTDGYPRSVKNGVYKNYFDNGKLQFEGNYVKNEKTGMHKAYDENGKLSEEGEYQAGKQVGVWKYYYETGAKKREESGRKYNTDNTGSYIVQFDGEITWDEKGNVTMKRGIYK
jgi:antitoxin component YwqK of YwqJK toxin-antitoxin module